MADKPKPAPKTPKDGKLIPGLPGPVRFPTKLRPGKGGKK